MNQNDRGSGEPADSPPYVDRGEPLPRSYAENMVVAMVRDPEHLFAYWDIATEVRVSGNPLVLRARSLSEDRFFDIVIDPQAQSWHLAVAPNRTYRLELYERRGSGELRWLAGSNEVSTPVNWSGESGREAPAEIVHAERHPIARQDPGRRRPAPHVAAPTEAPVAVPASSEQLASAHSGGL